MEIKLKQVTEKYQMASLVYMGMGTAFTTQVVLQDNGCLAEIKQAHEELESWLLHIEKDFSPFKEDSEVSRYNRGELDYLSMSEEMRFVYVSCAQALEVTHGAFNAEFSCDYNPSGFVKGWAIEEGFERYLKPLLENPGIIAANLNGGGDMQMATQADSDWAFGIGVVDPFDKMKLIAELPMKNGAIATSGTAERGDHIVGADKNLVQTTVIGQSLQEVDVWATALMVKLDSRMPSHLTAFAVSADGKIIEKS